MNLTTPSNTPYFQFNTKIDLNKTSVSIQAYTLNRRPDYFYDALSFAPERWLQNSQCDITSEYYRDRRQAMQPFSTGPRDCLGQNLAWAEMRLVLAYLILEFDIGPGPEPRLRWESLRTFLLVEKKPLLLHLKSRHEKAIS